MFMVTLCPICILLASEDYTTTFSVVSNSFWNKSAISLPAAVSAFSRQSNKLECDLYLTTHCLLDACFPSMR